VRRRKKRGGGRSEGAELRHEKIIKGSASCVGDTRRCVCDVALTDADESFRESA